MTDRERELLSAAYDRQASPAEQARAEELLRDSEEARQDWKQFEELSAMLRELPREELPAEFPSRVLKLAERRSLLPTTVRRRSPLRWLMAPAMALSAAAILIGGVWFFSPRPQETPLAMESKRVGDHALAPAPRSAPEIAPEETRDSKRPAETFLKDEVRELPAQQTATPAPAGGAVPERLEQTEAISKTVEARDAATRLAMPAAASPVSAKNVQVLTVFVDEQDGVQLVQRALERNQVASQANEIRTEEKSRVPDDALCIVASNEQITKALEELRKSHTVEVVPNQDTVLVARLPAEVQQFFLAEGTTREVRQKPAADGLPGAVRKSKGDDGAKAEADVAAKKEDSKPAASTAQSNGYLRARQMKTLTPSVLRESADKRVASESEEVRLQPEAPRPNAGLSTPAQPPVRMIVLIRQGKSVKAPAASKKGS